MQLAFPFLAGASLMLGGCHLISKDHDSGPRATRDFSVTGFTRLSVAGNYDVEVHTGGAPSVHAEGGKARLDALDVKVEGGTLRIGARSGMHWGWSDNGKVRLIVTVPALEAAELAGSGDISVDRASGPEFAGTIAGSGNLKLGAIKAQTVKLELSGSGGIQAAGETTTVSYNVSGSGDIDAAGLIAQTAALSMAGSGGIKAHASQSATIDMAGSGNVTMTGGGKCTIAKQGSGDVRCS